ncbi:MAG: hypothetical protein J0I06_23045 [Planctomycetes bacterium]|nr:hypothetical protein [Planctomycetota bacterium]
MRFARSIRYGAVAAVVAFAAPVALAGPPGHGGGHAGGHVGGVHMGGAHVGGAHYGGAHYAPVGGYHHYAPTHYSGYRGIGYGYGYGLYGPLGYGLGYRPFGYSGIGYGGVGYGALGYGYGYPSTSSISGVPITSGSSIPYQYIPAQPSTAPDPDPQPQPLPAPGSSNSGKGEPATITVITSEGATVAFDGLASEQTGACVA